MLLRNTEQAPRPLRGSLVRVAGRTLFALLVVSLVTIVVFAILYRLVEVLAPGWGYLGLPDADTIPAHDFDDILSFSMYVFFHLGGSSLLVPHGPDRVLVGVELAVSWAWFLVLGAWAMADLCGLRRDG